MNVFTHTSGAFLLGALSMLATAAQDPAGIETPFGSRATVLQDDPSPDPGSLQLWIGYNGSERVRFADHCDYLVDLTRRFGERGLRACVCLPEDSARTVVADRQWPFAVYSSPLPLPAEIHDRADLIEADHRPWVALTRPTRTAADARLALWIGLDGSIDPVLFALDGKGEAVPSDDTDLHLLFWIEHSLQFVADNSSIPTDVVQNLLVGVPHSGRAHATMVLHRLWNDGDVTAARRDARLALAQLGGESVALIEFADLMLRGWHDDPALAKEVMIAITPAAAALGEDSAFAQLVQLRAALLARQDRLAGRLAAPLLKRLRANPLALLTLAETLMEAATPMVHRDAATAALDACVGKVDPELVLACRFKILARTDADAAERQRVLAEYQKQSRFQRSGYNNDAWYLMTRMPTMGRFDELAKALCDAMVAEQGGSLPPNNRDTVALALFCAGKVERAVEEQREVVAATGPSPTYQARLKRYESVAAERAR
jgi:hypothetical protein